MAELPVFLGKCQVAPLACPRTQLVRLSLIQYRLSSGAVRTNCTKSSGPSKEAVKSVLADAPKPSQRLSENESKHQVDLMSPAPLQQCSHNDGSGRSLKKRPDAGPHLNCMSTSFSAMSLCARHKSAPIFEMQPDLDPTGGLANQLHIAAA